MHERRKYERLPIDCRLKVNNLYNGYQKGIDRVDADIEVVDISRGGIGFKCNQALPLNCYFDATIGLEGREYFRAIVKIIRCSTHDDDIIYGAEFIGLAGFLENKITEYSKKFNNDEKDI
ncbi:MAG: PilZ domain-containing protein [Lachnospiraceae bacterium]|nr:PilZ domain-containing protein [Lachnospiraceae bacterium]